MVKIVLLKIIISIVSLAIAALHIFNQEIEIDSIALVLIIIAFIPWLAYLLKIMELPGGFKLEFKDLQNTTNRAKDVGLISEDLSEKEAKDYSFQLISTDDPVLALAGLRIEIEKRLKKLAIKNNIDIRLHGVRKLIGELRKNKIINNQEHAVIADMIGTLNRAVHAEEINNKVADWAIEYGPKILKALDEKIDNLDITIDRRPKGRPRKMES